MKGFPNQVAELSKLSTAMQCVVPLTDAGEQAKDYGILGEALVRARVAGTGHTPMPVEQYLRIQRRKTRAIRAFVLPHAGCASFFGGLDSLMILETLFK